MISKITEAKLFIKFLDGNNIKKAYIKNCKSGDKGDSILCPKHFNEIINEPSFDWINLAFLWADTPEGSNFWNRIDIKWKNQLSKRGL